MRRGKYARIPERPEDLAGLWQHAEPLTPDTAPLWVTAETANRFRFLGSLPAAGLSADDQREFAEELELLRGRGLLIDDRLGDTFGHCIYVPAPRDSEIWSIGIVTGESPLRFPIATDINAVLTSRDVTDVVATFVADPFMLRREDGWFMFFEIMNWHLRRGQIGFAFSENGTDWTYGGVVLTEPFHLSYPYVFEWNGRYYMIPETNKAKAIRLYEAVSFPTAWRHTATLAEGQYFADASIVRHQETWWVFVDTSPKKKNNRLSLYYADALTGPWIEHPASPIVRDDRRIARPGGRVVTVGDTVIRYAQNCLPSYGSEVLAFEITELTRARYAERPAMAGPVLKGTGAGWNAKGMHNIDPHRLEDGQWLACVDGWTTERGWTDFADAPAEMDQGLMLRDIERIVPPGSTFLIVDKGREILGNGVRRAIPFPEKSGVWGGYPATDADALSELDRLRADGGEYIVFPAAMTYWLDAYPALRRHLTETGGPVLENSRVSIYSLKTPEGR